MRMPCWMLAVVVACGPPAPPPQPPIGAAAPPREPPKPAPVMHETDCIATGTIHDLDAGDIAMGATVVYDHDGNASEEVVLTDDEGKFRIALHRPGGKLLVYYADLTAQAVIRACPTKPLALGFHPARGKPGDVQPLVVK